MKNLYLVFVVLLLGATMNAQNFKFGKVSKEEVESKAHPLNSDANVAVLYREVIIYYNYDKNLGFVLITEVHERIKIYNKDGFDWATKEIGLYVSNNREEEVIEIKGETYNIENGKLVSQKLEKDGIFDENENKYRNRKKITMPGIKEGSVIEYKYTITSPFLSSIDKIQLQYTIPIDNLEVTVKVPEYFIFKRHTNPKSQLNFKIEESTNRISHTNTTTQRSGFQVVQHSQETSKLEYVENIYSIIKGDIPALKKEEYVDYLNNYAAVLNWELLYTKFPSGAIENYSENWDDVVNKIYNENEFGKELKDTKYFTQDLAQVLDGVTMPQDKINTIFQFVKSKVKWNDYVGYFADYGVREAY
tara:strand:+ start:3927 stop:5009 length:1083 start_codon:yes stop_codon:yes gene_type:complete